MSWPVSSTTLSFEIHGGHLQSDDAAADDQHALRHAAELERTGGIDDPRVVGNER
jgi:hypothetical protein